ncbi:MAG: hypothetical protein KGL68_03895 [Burkholderiales bacterium]|nr:hypothetical protein [Burkholderiales bacterium]
MTRPIHAYQIFYNEATRAAIDPAFEPLDNLANERPDWYEYWPIRRFFQTHPVLDESALYGFFSPLFFSKTHLTGRQVLDFAGQVTDAEVITFSPHPCHGAAFYNVFEQGANAFPGFLDAALLFLRELDPQIRLDQLINDSRNTVYSNYFLARPRFWRAWLAIVDRAFALAEAGDTAAGQALIRPVGYAKSDGDTKPAQMKIMVLERIPSLLLAWGDFTVRNYPPFAIPLTAQFAGHLAELKELDRLKIAYGAGGDRQLLQQYVQMRDGLLAAVRSRPQAG